MLSTCDVAQVTPVDTVLDRLQPRPRKLSYSPQVTCVTWIRLSMVQLG